LLELPSGLAAIHLVQETVSLRRTREMAAMSMMRACLLAAALLVASGDEMAFVDVSSTDTINIRQLDVPVNSKRGIASFFTEDPMAAHDWAIQSTMLTTLRSELAAVAKPRSAAAGRIRKIEEELSPLWRVAKKNERGAITNNTMRYVAHRYFTNKYGWSVKGLQPAGASWLHVMAVTPDVRQVTKYIAPTYLHEELLTATGAEDLDIHRLALFISTIEHLIHAEMLDYLYSVHRVMQVKVAGEKTEGELDTIISSFMLIYAFGTNLEVSTKRDLDKSAAFLQENHKGWQQLQARIQDLKKSKPDAGTKGFNGLMDFVEAIAKDYRQWQNPTCTEARERLLAMPSYKDGQVSLADFAPVHVAGYRLLFSEQQDYLQKLGALDESTAGDPKLLVANYITSQALCLTTASYYTVCCHNPCEDIMAKLEHATGEPSATADQIASALAEGGAGRLLTEAERASLDALTANNSRVVLHERPLAMWLHSIFPVDCPMPRDHETINPKTADEWMADPGSNVQDTEELMLEVSDNLARYTTLGLEGVDASLKEEEAAEEVDESVDHIVEPYTAKQDINPANGSRRGAGFGSFCQMLASLAMLASMVALIVALVQSALATSGLYSDKVKVHARPLATHDIVA